MKKWLKYIDWKFRVIFMLAIIGGLIAFTEVSVEGQKVNDINVELLNTTNNHFLEANDIIEIMINQAGTKITGMTFQSLDLGALEKELELNDYIDYAEVYKDLEGNIQATVSLKRPVARIIMPFAADAYLTLEGELLPTSEKFVSRVMLLRVTEGSKFSTREFWNSPDGTPYLEVISFINNDELWKAQISEMIIDTRGKIRFLPQVGKQIIEFGLPKDIEARFFKLETFFSKVLPSKGWNTYDRVNLEYENQIIAE